jgi:hypothetical protein
MDGRRRAASAGAARLVMARWLLPNATVYGSILSR